jgi:pimeloyl-ACP methyl ester carboxylesterase
MKAKMPAGIAIGLALALVGAWAWTPDRPRAALEAKYSHGPQDFREVAGLRLHVRVEGPADAPAVLLLHGLGSSLHTWDAWAEGLARDHRVVRLDLPGFGLTGPDPSGDYSDARAVTVLEALLDDLGIARASVIGHSMGGRIAWTFAAQRPGRVAKLVLVSPDGFASPGFEYGKAPHVPAVMKAMRYVLPKPLLRMNLAPGYADPRAMTDALVERYYELLLAPGVRGAILDRTAQTVLRDPTPMLRTIRAPTLLLWGEKDAMIPFANSADYGRALPDSRLVALPGVGHLPQEEAAGVSLEKVRAFLDEGL